MQKIFFLAILICATFITKTHAQDTTDVSSEEPLEAIDFSELGDASDAKVYCTSKLINLTPTRMVSLGYEHNLGFTNTETGASTSSFPLNGMGGLRASAQVLALSTNKIILSIGANYWGSKASPGTTASGSAINTQLFNNRLDLFGLNASLFKPLDKKHFIIAQLNSDLANIGMSNNLSLNSKGLTVYGSALYGWKKDDYKMAAIGIARTYRLGRPLFVPIFLYNKTFNNHWGVEMLLPARAHVRYNFNTTNILLAGFELEGQQYYMQAPTASTTTNWMQRGEIKPRLDWQKKLFGFVWLGTQVGYRIGYRLNAVDKYNGKEANEILVNNWGGSPYFNVSLSFVSP